MFSNPLKKYRFLASVLTSTTRFHVEIFSYFLDMAVHVSGKIIKLDISRDLKAFPFSSSFSTGSASGLSTSTDVSLGSSPE